MWNSAHLPVHPSRPIKRPVIRHCWQLLALRSNKGLPKPKTTDSDCRSHSKNSMTFVIPCHPVNHRNPFRSKYIYDHASVEREFSLASVGRQNLTPVLRHATSPWLRSKWSASGPAECRLHVDLPLGGSRPSLSLCLTMLFGYDRLRLPVGKPRGSSQSFRSKQDTPTGQSRPSGPWSSLHCDPHSLDEWCVQFCKKDRWEV